MVSYVRNSVECDTTNMEIQSNVPRTCKKSLTIDYNYEEMSCSKENSISFDRWKRNYVVKELYMESGTCQGKVSQAYAIAADNTCHPVPHGTEWKWTMVNCNGGNPIWKTCEDKRCMNCTTEAYGGEPCTLKAAMASDKVRCVTQAQVQLDKPKQTPATDDELIDVSASNRTFVTTVASVTTAVVIFLVMYL